MWSGWLLPIAEGEQRFKFFSSFYTYRSCWMWLISPKWNCAKRWKWTNANRRNDIDTVGVHAGCVLTAFEDSSFNGDQVFHIALYLHNPGNKQEDNYSEAIVKKLHFSNLIFALRSPSELILVIGEKHQLWFISPFTRLNWIQFIDKSPCCRWVVLAETPGYEHMHEEIESVKCVCWAI